MRAEKSRLNRIIKTCLIATACVSMNVSAGEATVWSDSSGDVIKDGAGDCLRTIWWQKGSVCGNENPDKHTHAATGTQSAMEHSHEDGSKAHQHKPANVAPAAAAATAATAPVEKAAPAPVAKAAPVMVPFSVSSAAAFKTSGSDLSDEGKAEIKAFAEKLEGRDITSITVEGYTDSTGSAEYNQRLSEQRVASVKDEMVKNGIDASIITVIGHGENDPIADNETSEGRAKNRRVVVSVEANN